MKQIFVLTTDTESICIIRADLRKVKNISDRLLNHQLGKSNPYDCEPYYNLGLSLKKQGKINTAFDAFYKAVWDGNMQDKAFLSISLYCIGQR